jgi:hypothetical protein
MGSIELSSVRVDRCTVALGLATEVIKSSAQYYVGVQHLRGAAVLNPPRRHLMGAVVTFQPSRLRVFQALEQHIANSEL